MYICKRARALSSKAASTVDMMCRFLGNGMVLMPQTQLQSMFGVHVRSSVAEPQIIMKHTKVAWIFC